MYRELTSAESNSLCMEVYLANKTDSDSEDLSGKFVIASYDELPYVGQVLQDVGEEVQVRSMRQSMTRTCSYGHKLQM